MISCPGFDCPAMYRPLELNSPIGFRHLPGPRRVCVALCLLVLAGCATAPDPEPAVPEPMPEPPPPMAIVDPVPDKPEDVAEVEPEAPERPPETPVVDVAPDPAAEKAAELARILGLRIGLLSGEMTVIEAAESIWPNACLGFPADGEICAEVLTPGYAVTLEVDFLRYSFRTDESLEQIRLVAAPLPEIGTTLAVWKDTRSSFATATVGSDGFAIGLRGGPQMTLPFVSLEREASMAELLERFAPFQAITEAGEIDFHGTGTEVAGFLEQRMVAEWIRGTYQSVWIDGTPDLPATVLTWERVGGIAGFCDIVAISPAGEVTVSDCRGDGIQPLARSWLNRRQLTELYGWMDTLESFASNQSDPAASDALTISITLKGEGLTKADPGVLAAIHRLASDLYLQAYETANAN